MNKTKAITFVLVVLLLAVPLLIRSQTLEDVRSEMNRISSEIDRLDKMIRENKKLSGMLRDQESRLQALTENSRIYRLPILVEGKALYVTVNESELDDFSSALALEDLLTKHKVTKGRFRSDAPSEWKKVLIQENLLAKDHLKSVELPEIQKRTAEVDQETSVLEARRKKLYERYMILQQRANS